MITAPFPIVSRRIPAYASLILCAWLLLLLPAAFAAAPAAQPAANPVPAPAAISLSAYRNRLESLDQLLASCQQSPGPANCRSAQVGPDAQIAFPSGSRQIRFTWLREVLDEAANDQPAKDAPSHGQPMPAKAETPKSPPSDDEDDSSETEPSKDASKENSSPNDKQSIALNEDNPPTLAVVLQNGRKRLSQEMQQADRLAADASHGTGPVATSSSSPQRRTLTAILAAREYNAAVAQPSLWDRALEKIGNWIDRVLSKLIEAGSKSQWIGYAAEIAFGILVCVGLVWFVIRMERQGRLGPSLLSSQPGSGAASARDWQLWLQDARAAAAQGAWRNAIHLTYWASISRLESAGQWPADRARTPREYLVLLSPESSQRNDLNAITRSFERTWYAGRPADEADFLQAEEIAVKLGANPRSNPRHRPGDE